MKNNWYSHFQSRLLALFMVAGLLLQAGFTTSVLAAPQAVPASVGQGSVPGIIASPFTNCATAVGIPSSECDALVALYNSALGPQWSDNTNWLQNNLPCSWFGVTCGAGHVTDLDEDNNNLNGTLPTELGNLIQLTGLELYGNSHLTGSIPTSLGSLTSLINLDLDNDQLSGSIPSSLGSLTNLNTLDLDDNQLSGGIPNSLGSLTNLTRLFLENNLLSGGIPTTLGSLTNLTDLNLSNNQLSGGIPTTLGSLSSLFSLGLSFNQLSGSIPTTLGSLSSLNYLYLEHNQLSGSIPASLGSLSNLVTLALVKNQLSGAFPLTFTAANLVSLTTLTADCWITSSDASVISFIATFFGAGWELNTCAPFTSCATVSAIPSSECDALLALFTSTDGATTWFDTDNWLYIDNPCQWFGVTCIGGHVTQLNLWHNGLHGTLPAALGNLPQLAYLNLGYDWTLTGSIPTALGSLAQLRYLNISQTDLIGAIPTQLGSLSQLRYLYLYDDALSGSIPTELGNLTNLYILDLHSNQLSGSIPASLGTLAQLYSLNLRYNQLTGTLPALSGLTSLASLDVSYNKLGGDIPASIIGLGSASVMGKKALPGFLTHSKHADKPEGLMLRPQTGPSIFSGVLSSLSLSCGLTSSDPSVIAFVDNLIPGWMDNRCVTTITTQTPNPSPIGQSVNVTVTVGGGVWVQTGTVHISGADAPCDITLFNGTGSCNVVFSTGGVQTLTAIYAENSYNYWGSSATATHTVQMERSLNGGFNTYVGKSKIPQSWVAAKFGLTDGKDLKVKKEGLASVKIIGAAGKSKTLTQTLALSGVPGDVFAFSFWAKGAFIPVAGLCRAQVMLFNGAALVFTQTVNCATGTYVAFQQKTVSFTTPSAYTKAVIKFTYAKASGTVWFDAVSLLR